MRLLNNLWNTIDGRKTYVVAAVTVLYAVVMVWSGDLSSETALQMILGALGLGTLRHGVSKR